MQSPCGIGQVRPRGHGHLVPGGGHRDGRRPRDRADKIAQPGRARREATAGVAQAAVARPTPAATNARGGGHGGPWPDLACPPGGGVSLRGLSQGGCNATNPNVLPDPALPGSLAPRYNARQAAPGDEGEHHVSP